MDDQRQEEASTGQPHEGDVTSTPGRSGMPAPDLGVPMAFISLLAGVWTKLWRIHKAILRDEADQQTLAAYGKRLSDVIDTIGELGFLIREHTGERFVNGMSLRVLLFQQREGIETETISETIRPSIFYKNQLVQMGEVIVDTPATLSPKKGGSP